MLSRHRLSTFPWVWSYLVWEKVQVVMPDTGVVDEKTIAAKDNPVIQAQAKPFVDQSQVFRIFGFADAVTRALLAAIEPAKPTQI
jgi:hypothetical protein